MAAVENLLIEQSKIDDYLLNIDHIDGRSKAKFFLERGVSLSAAGFGERSGTTCHRQLAGSGCHQCLCDETHRDRPTGLPGWNGT